MKVAQEFSRYAAHYNNYNIIQNRVVKKLISDMKTKPSAILDLGCGSGAVYNEISWKLESFIGIDFAEGMLEQHPQAKNITCKHGDFNKEEFFEELKNENFDYIISASALQWSDDLDFVFKSLSFFQVPLSLAIFTCKTFETLYKTAGLKPLLRCPDAIIDNAKQYFDASYELVSYTLEFESKKELFRYIKRSGVSGNRRVLDYKQTRALMQEYPHKSLEFEVLFIHAR
ncbi:MAG: methyltransferase domain-containing protein [Campylobacterota bacterium]|nr:methyltransferase domain-containing protein [Campylobacterota bacterium]